MKKLILFCVIFFINLNNIFAKNDFTEKIALKDWNKFLDCVTANSPYKNNNFAMTYCFCLYSYSARNNDFFVINEVIEKFNLATATQNTNVKFTEETEKIKRICSIYK